jgi:uncharacterized membrane protein YeaQ/YmgE (transglycosylase-associated protein family)
MHISGESVFIILMVGGAAGWLAGQILQGTGFGIAGDLVIGIAGAFVGARFLPQFQDHFGIGALAAVINAAMGAVLLLLVIAIVRGASGWRGSRGQRG